MIFCDLNPTEWLESFDSGLWELSDPIKPTFPSRTPLDKFVLGPGEDGGPSRIPSPVDPEAAEGDSDYPTRHLSAQFPFCVDLPLYENDSEQTGSATMLHHDITKLINDVSEDGSARTASK